MVSIKFWYIKHYGARVGDVLSQKNNYLNVPNGYSKYNYFSKAEYLVVL